MEKKELEKKFRIWQDLLDTSLYFALAGMKLKGYSERKSRDNLRRLWIESSQEHRQGNLNIIKKLYGKTNKHK